jgi:putative oxidoreductase
VACLDEACFDWGVQRLFSSFADGTPGAGLLLMRLAAAAYLALRAAGIVLSSVANIPGLSIGLSLLCAVTALLLLIGLWTPVSGILAAVAAGWHCVAVPSSLPSADLLLGVLGIALALLGPGAWSLDARLFGWTRLEIPSGPPDESGT